MIKTRLDHELPECIRKWGWKYHHPGAPIELIEFDRNML